jgi:tRNA(Ile)-lysidine synthase
VSDLVERIAKTIAERRLIRRGESMLVAVSGGLDSMVLLHVLAELRRAHKWKLTVAHFNHQLRGRSSDADERLVTLAAKKLKLPFVRASADVKAYAKAHGFSLEMAGRKLRHEFLAKEASGRKIKTVALAHHADDQVELFFLRLLRGAGSEGLAGMKWRSPSPMDERIQLVRPLLEQSKDGLQAFAKARGIAYREDATNARLDMRRNRIRRELIPLLTKNYQPALRRVILREMETLRAEAGFMDSAAQEWLKGKDGMKFDGLSVALQRHILQLQLPALGVAGNFGLIEELREAAKRPVTVSEKLSLYRDPSGKVHAQVDKIITKPLEKKVALRGKRGEIHVGNVLICWVLGADNGTFRADKRTANCEYFDAKKVGNVIVLRHWRPGDRFQPIGMKAPVKLQDLFVNRKVPRAERHGRVVGATADGTIFWVEGLRMAERFKLDNRTTRRLKWQWKRL